MPINFQRPRAQSMCVCLFIFFLILILWLLQLISLFSSFFVCFFFFPFFGLIYSLISHSFYWFLWFEILISVFVSFIGLRGKINTCHMFNRQLSTIVFVFWLNHRNKAYLDESKNTLHLVWLKLPKKSKWEFLVLATIQTIYSMT